MSSSMSMWSYVHMLCQRALSCGALEPIRASVHSLPRSCTSQPIEWTVFLMDAAPSCSSPALSSSSSSSNGRKPNNFPESSSSSSCLSPKVINDPFLPPEEALSVHELDFAGHVSEMDTEDVTCEKMTRVDDVDDDRKSQSLRFFSHRCVLNKFPVFPLHLLLVTTRFAPQWEPLTEIDFAAALHAMDRLGMDYAFCFYNQGVDSGPSQPHRHMQIVPWKRNSVLGADASEALENVPDLPLISRFCAAAEAARNGDEVEGSCDGDTLGLPFPCRVASIEHIVSSLLAPERKKDEEAYRRAGQELVEIQAKLVAHLEERFSEIGLKETSEQTIHLFSRLKDPESWNFEQSVTYKPSPFSYNILFTSKFLAAVPRNSERSHGFPLNGLGYAGSLVAKNSDALQYLEEHDIAKILRDGTPA